MCFPAWFWFHLKKKKTLAVIPRTSEEEEAATPVHGAIVNQKSRPEVKLWCFQQALLIGIKDGAASELSKYQGSK